MESHSDSVFQIWLGIFGMYSFMSDGDLRHYVEMLVFSFVEQIALLAVSSGWVPFLMDEFPLAHRSIKRR